MHKKKYEMFSPFSCPRFLYFPYFKQKTHRPLSKQLLLVPLMSILNSIRTSQQSVENPSSLHGEDEGVLLPKRGSDAV